MQGASEAAAAILQCLSAAPPGPCVCPSLPPLLRLPICTSQVRTAVTIACTTVGLAAFGGLAAWLGGANKLRAAARVLLGGWAAMGATYGIGTLFELA